MTQPRHLLAGQAAEAYARRWLERRGLQHLLSNYCCKVGEIDLVMRHQDILVVVEVRYRAHAYFGGAAGSISQQKQQRIARATAQLLRMNPVWLQHALRFDVVALSGEPPDMQVDWRQRAFYVDS